MFHGLSISPDSPRPASPCLGLAISSPPAAPQHFSAAGRAAELVAALPERQHVLVTGATGFIGSRLVAALAEAGHQVTVLARDPAKAAALTPPFRLITSLDQIASDAAIDTIVNLAGEPIANELWTTAKRRRALALAPQDDPRRGAPDRPARTEARAAPQRFGDRRGTACGRTRR